MLTDEQKQRKQEIYEDIINRRGPSNPLTKSQKKHLKKVAKKRMKSEERKQKQLHEQEISGRLIEESHNGGEYTPGFTEKAANWYITELRGIPEERIYRWFQTRREKYQTLLLKWATGLPRDHRFYFFRGLLDLYWEDKTGDTKIIEYVKNYLESSGRDH